jgi:hypothetical protein
MKFNLSAVTVPQSETVSSTFHVAGIDILGVLAPVITSCQLFLQVSAGSSEPTSASFVRMAPTSLSSGQLLPFVWNVGPGSASATVDVEPWGWARIETGVPMANAASFSLVGGDAPRK